MIVTGALFFWQAQMVRWAPTALTGFFDGFRTYFVTSVRVSVASAGVLALAGLGPPGARKPQGGRGRTLSALLGYVPVLHVINQPISKTST